MELQNISAPAVSPRGRRYIVSFACINGINELALIDEDADDFVKIGGKDVNVFYSFTDMSEILTLFREKIVALDVGFAIDAQKIDIRDTDLHRSIDLHPAGELKKI